jgi:phosphatidylserine decarboxylase
MKKIFRFGLRSHTNPPADAALDKSNKYILSVIVSQGKDLLSKDSNGKSDPFLVLKVDQHAAKSSIVMKSLNPIWNERLELVLDNKPKSCVLECYDWDRVSKNDFIGKADIDVSEELWKSKQSTVHWVNLKDGKKDAGKIEIQIQVNELTAAEMVDRHSDAYFHSISHFLKVNIKEAKNLKSKDLVTKNDSVCKVSFGSQAYHTKVVGGSNPAWNQTTWINVCQSRQKSFKLLLEIVDKDVGDKFELIGSRYFDIDALFDTNDTVPFDFVDIYNNKAVKDKDLSQGVKIEDLNKGDVTGQISLELELIPKSKALKQILHAIGSLVKESHSDEKSSDSGYLKSDFDTVMLFIDPSLSEADRDELFKSLDKNSDGNIDKSEIVNVLNSSKFYFNGLARKMLSLDPENQSNLLNNLMDRDEKRRSDSVIVIRERVSGLEIEENIPGYIKVAMQLMFANAVGRTFANSTVPLLHKMSVLQGEKYNKPESSMEIEKFIQIHSLNRDEFDKEIHEYVNFNEFFARGMRDLDVKRPLSSPDNHGVAVCPADCRLMVFPELLDATNLWIKGDKFSLENLLGPDASHYAQQFKGGSFVIARLAPQDYHRWHTPVQGVFGKRFPISGALYTVNPIAINKPVNVYTENKREVCLIDSDEFGAVILIAVAATMVGSINVVDGDEGSACNRGAVHGKFLFGGSTVLLLFQPGTIRFADDLLFNSTHDPKRPIETLVKVRSKLGDAVKPGKRLNEL